MSRLFASLTLACVTVTWPLVAQQQAPAQPPRFKAGVEVMRIEMTVLDKRTRAPIRGLTAADFVVKVNGIAQEIVALSEVVTTPPAKEAAAWTRESPIEVAKNTQPPVDQQRLIVIVMDDAIVFPHIGGGTADPYHRKIGKATAHRIVDELGPNDLAAVLFPQFNQHAQDFTSDRAALRRAIETYNPQQLHPLLANAMSLGVLTRAGEFLGSIPDRRRAIFYITPGPKIDQSDSDPLGWAENVTQRMASTGSELGEGLANAMRPVTVGSRMAQVPVYPISILGLEAPSVRELVGRLPPRSREANENLQHIARSTGGRAIVDNNAPDREVREVFEELSSYYVLAYTASFPMDGKLRRLSVDVKRPGASVQPDGIVLTTPREKTSLGPATVKSGVDSGLVAAIAGPLQSGALPMELTVAPFADPGVTRATAVMTLGIMVPPGSSSALPGNKDQAPVEVRIFDGEGRKEITHGQLTINVTTNPESASLAEAALRFDLKPGRYNVRVGAGIAGTGVSGSVFTTFTVPDFDKETVSLSGVAIGRAARRAVGGLSELGDVLPFAPTVERDFARTDIVGALVRVHQASKRAPSEVTLTTTITGDGGEVSRSTHRFEAAKFETTRSVEHRAELDVKPLAPGNYLLTFTATAAGGVTATRQVRFSVR
jgi:VWFA-related protein